MSISVSLLVVEICLTSQPCQSLFVAPCSHVWHYKCIRPILTGLQYPHLTCPNCRMSIDLEADIEEEESDWEEDLQEAIEASKREKESQAAAEPNQPNGAPATDGDVNMLDEAPVSLPPPPQRPAPGPPAPPSVEPPTPTAASLFSPFPQRTTPVSMMPPASPLTPAETTPLSSSQPRAIPPRSAARGELGPVVNGVLMATNGDGGPLTPRNNIGPFVLDGAAGRPPRDERSRSRTPLADGEVARDEDRT